MVRRILLLVTVAAIMAAVVAATAGPVAADRPDSFAPCDNPTALEHTNAAVTHTGGASGCEAWSPYHRGIINWYTQSRYYDEEGNRITPRNEDPAGCHKSEWSGYYGTWVVTDFKGDNSDNNPNCEPSGL
jgi:hypothetical protein